MTEDLGVLEEPVVSDHLLKLGRVHKEIIHAVGFTRALRAGRMRDGPVRSETRTSERS